MSTTNTMAPQLGGAELSQGFKEHAEAHAARGYPCYEHLGLLLRSLSYHQRTDPGAVDAMLKVAVAKKDGFDISFATLFPTEADRRRSELSDKTVGDYIARCIVHVIDGYDKDSRHFEPLTSVREEALKIAQDCEPLRDALLNCAREVISRPLSSHVVKNAATMDSAGEVITRLEGNYFSGASLWASHRAKAATQRTPAQARPSEREVEAGRKINFRGESTQRIRFRRDQPPFIGF